VVDLNEELSKKVAYLENQLESNFEIWKKEADEKFKEILLKELKVEDHARKQMEKKFEEKISAIEAKQEAMDLRISRILNQKINELNPKINNRVIGQNTCLYSNRVIDNFGPLNDKNRVNNRIIKKQKRKKPKNSMSTLIFAVSDTTLEQMKTVALEFDMRLDYCLHEAMEFYINAFLDKSER